MYTVHSDMIHPRCVFLGYAFLIFNEEGSVHGLIKNCIMEDGKMYMFVSSVTQTNKKVGLHVTMMYLCVL